MVIRLSTAILMRLWQLARIAMRLKTRMIGRKYRLRLLEYKEQLNVLQLTALQEEFGVAVSLIRQSKAAEAEQEIARLFEYYEELLRLDNLRTLATCYWHAECQKMLGKYETATEHYVIVVSHRYEKQSGWEK